VPRRKGVSRKKKRGTHHRVKGHTRTMASGKKTRVKGHARRHPSRGKSPGSSAIRATSMSPF
jgi:hypothetical protein